MLIYSKYFSWIVHCANCGTVFENKYDSECKVCGSTRKSYKTPQPADWKTYEEPKKEKRKEKSGIKISKRTLAILTLFIIALTVGIVTTIDDISNPSDDYTLTPSDDYTLTPSDDYTLTPSDDYTITISYSDVVPPNTSITLLEDAIQDSVNRWADINPNLKFEIVSSNADIHVTWKYKLTDGHAGFIQGDKISIALGSYDCNSKWFQFSQNTLSDIIAHEIGHYLGMEHHSQPNHLMYGNDEYVQMPFNDLGYEVPIKPDPYPTWLGHEVRVGDGQWHCLWEGYVNYMINGY